MLTLTFGYKRATPQRAFVRTGMGGTKAVVNGGALAFPHLNDVAWVNMTAMRFDVMCCDEDALLFESGAWQGRAECIVRVAPHEFAVEQAATRWGDKTLTPDALQPLIEGCLIEALKHAARQDTKEQICQRTNWDTEGRAAFASLEAYGLLLESIRMIEAPCD